MAGESLATSGQQSNTDGSSSQGAEEGAPAGEEQTSPEQTGEGGQGGEQPTASEGQQAPEHGGEAGAEASGESAEGQGEKAGEENGEQGPPEQYDFSGVMPEGMEADQEVLKEAEPVFKELGLTNEQAGKLAAIQAKHIQQVQQQAEESHQQQVEQWKQDVQNDPEIGGDALDENLATAKKALDAFASDGFKQMLDESGFGNHPDVVKTFHAIGQKIGEDNFVAGDSPSAPEKSREERLYGGTTPTKK